MHGQDDMSDEQHIGGFSILLEPMMSVEATALPPMKTRYPLRLFLKFTKSYKRFSAHYASSYGARRTSVTVILNVRA